MNMFEPVQKTFWQTILTGLFICGLVVAVVVCIDLVTRALTKEPPQTLPGGLVRYDVALRRLKDTIHDDFAEPESLSDHLDHLASIALDDPQEALRQRLPMARCRASALAPNCDQYGLLFATDIVSAPSDEPEMWYNRPSPGDQSQGNSRFD